jgi:hypothetical protein
MHRERPDQKQVLTSEWENTLMRRVCGLIAGVAMAFTLTGCGDTPPETGTVQFKPTQNPAIDGLRESMSKSLASGGKAAKKADATGKPVTDTKAAGTKAVEKD